MMNKNIDNELQELIDENDRLLSENDNLKNQLLAAKAASEADSTLEEYYANKYLSLHDKVRKMREKEIETKIVEYENNKLKLVDQELNFGRALDKDEEFNQRNKELEKQEREVSARSYDLNKKQKSIQDFYDSRIKSNIEPLFAKYDELLKQLYSGNNISGLYASIITDIRSSYPLASELRELNVKKEEELAQIKAEIEQLKLEKEALKEKRDHLLDDIKNDFDNEISEMSDHYSNTIELENKLKQELAETFDALKESNVRDIIDQTNYYKLTGTPLNEASELIEKLIDKKIEELKSQETFASLKAHKEVRLADINLELNKLDEINERLEKLVAKENYLYKIYIEAANAVDEIVDFLDQSTLAIEENQIYSDVVKRYISAKQRVDDYRIEYERLNQKFDQLSQEKKEKTMCAFPEEEIQNITSRLAEVNADRFKIGGYLADAKYEIEEIEKNYENLKLLAVLRERDYAQSKLPTMYKNLRELKFKLNNLKLKERELQSSLTDYEALKAEKERLTDEINN